MRIGGFKGKRLLIIICFVVVSFLVFILFLSRSAELTPQQAQKYKTKGSPAAPIKIVEYTDFECPACASASQVLAGYQKGYPKKIYTEYRFFPIISIHPHALAAASYSECAARQRKFWDFHDDVINRRKEWARNEEGEKVFIDIATENKLDLGQLDACAHSEEVMDTVLAQKNEGKARGVNATPTFFINGKKVVGSRQLKKELDQLLGIEGIAEGDQ